jgi:hypothetical protein
MSKRNWLSGLTIALLAGIASLGPNLCGQQPGAPKAPTAKQAADTPEHQVKPAAADGTSENDDKNFVYLNKDHDLWIDKKQKQIVMKGIVAVREGNLEMFACPQQSKEYESIVAVAPRDMAAVHAALLALGAKPGHPARFNEKFIPADGTQIDVEVRWKDKEGKKHESPAQDWVRNMKTGKALEYSWVFAGSGFFVDPDSKEQRYLANDGDFICVVNFSDSMLDLSIESPKAWSEHVFEPFTQRIPPKGTEVELVLTPKIEKK